MEEKEYSKRISRTTLLRIKKGINNYIFIARRYRDTRYSAKALAKDIRTNTRYLSAAINVHYGCNYADLVNRLRIDDAKAMLIDSNCTMSVEDIAVSCGFANRQSFYTAFTKFTGMTPREFRQVKLSQADEPFEILPE